MPGHPPRGGRGVHLYAGFRGSMLLRALVYACCEERGWPLFVHGNPTIPALPVGLDPPQSAPGHRRLCTRAFPASTCVYLGFDDLAHPPAAVNHYERLLWVGGDREAVRARRARAPLEEIHYFAVATRAVPFGSTLEVRGDPLQLARRILAVGTDDPPPRHPPADRAGSFVSEICVPSVSRSGP